MTTGTPISQKSPARELAPRASPASAAKKTSPAPKEKSPASKKLFRNDDDDDDEEEGHLKTAHSQIEASPRRKVASSSSSSTTTTTTTTKAGVREKGDVTTNAMRNFRNHVKACNRLLNTIHEATGVKMTSEERKALGIEDDYGGISGTIVPSSFSKMTSVLLGETAEDGRRLPGEYLLKNKESVFCDIGCGTGRPTFYMAALPLRASLGFDIEKIQVLNSCAGWQRLTRSKQNLAGVIKFEAPIALFHGNATAYATLSPVTHAYAFVGYEKFVGIVARLAASTPTLKALTLVTPYKDVLLANGLVSEAFNSHTTSSSSSSSSTKTSKVDDDVVRLGGMKMASGRSYPGFIFPMTRARRDMILEATDVPEIREQLTNVCLSELEDVVERVTKNRKVEEERLMTKGLKILNSSTEKGEEENRPRRSQRGTERKKKQEQEQQKQQNLTTKAKKGGQ